MVVEVNSGEKVTRLNVSKEVRRLYDEDPSRDWQAIFNILTASYSGVNIGRNLVQMALLRHKENLHDPERHRRIDGRSKVARLQKEIEGMGSEESVLRVSETDIADSFKEILKYKKFAASEGIDMKVSEITTYLDKTNQLVANEAEYIRKDKIVEDACRLIFEFRTALDCDPEINDPLHSFEDE